MDTRTLALASAAEQYADALLAQRAASLTYEACKRLPPAERAVTMSDAMQRWRAAMDRLNTASAAILRAAALDDAGVLPAPSRSQALRVRMAIAANPGASDAAIARLARVPHGYATRVRDRLAARLGKR